MNERKKFIIECRKKRMSYREIGEILGISRQRAQQIEAGYMSPKDKKKLLESRIHLYPFPEDLEEFVSDGKIRIRKKIECIKILTPRKRKHLGLADIRELYKIFKNPISVIREEVRIRDNRTCKICLKIWTTGEKRFDVHHLEEINGKSAGALNSCKYDRANMDKMITLCHKCHMNLHKTQRINKKVMHT
jgi:transcriptional regulator with XRE-family HTH domain